MARTGRIIRSSVWIAAGVLLAMACGKRDQYASTGATSNATTSARDTMRTAAKDTSQPNGAANGVAPASYVSEMNDSNVVAALDNLDKAEVEIGQLMQSKATNDSVRAFARKLAQDHTKNEKRVQGLERHDRLAEVPAKTDSTRSHEIHAIRQLREMPRGRSLDSAFVQAMLMGHEHAVANAKAMENHVKNSQLKTFLQQTLPTLQEHLSIAQRLSEQLEGTRSNSE